MLERRGHYWYRVTNSGYGRKGAQDVIACVQGLYLAIEAKVPPDKLSPWQQREQIAVQKSKGRAIVAKSVEEAERVVIELERYYVVSIVLEGAGGMGAHVVS